MTIKFNPPITKQFVASIRKNTKHGAYRVSIGVEKRNVSIDVFPSVFPPSSRLSNDTNDLTRAIRHLKGKRVADIGCGTGVLSILACINGAEHVDAVDINPVAVKCTRHNVQSNNLERRVSVFCGNLFNPLGRKKYDCIIANLPYVDFRPSTERSIRWALYDADLKLHKRFLREAGSHLTKKGYCILRRANLQSARTKRPNADFEELEQLMNQNGYQILDVGTSRKLGYIWKTYRIHPVHLK